ncbi:MAG: heme-copper oxidase subunit III [Stenomitos rutilans HA7619-LM2]|jgi:cytochrome c oxidase subunit 3|nr:heme-copper oxidase subunit III [Stenomitos rutilans HA7619-LM2]
MDTSVTPEQLQSSAEHDHKDSEHADNRMFGFIVFLLSESMVFLGFFGGYIALKLTTADWLPPGVNGLDIFKPAINTAVLVSSSFVIYFGELALERNKLNVFRFFLLATAAMGTYFLVGQAIEWNGLSFGLTTGLFGGTFYLLTGFHGLHVFVGILLQLGVLIRSFTPKHATPENHYGFAATSLFWHFVDVIWIVLFSLIYLWQ